MILNRSIHPRSLVVLLAVHLFGLLPATIIHFEARTCKLGLSISMLPVSRVSPAPNPHLPLPAAFHFHPSTQILTRSGNKFSHTNPGESHISWAHGFPPATRTLNDMPSYYFSCSNPGCIYEICFLHPKGTHAGTITFLRGYQPYKPCCRPTTPGLHLSLLPTGHSVPYILLPTLTTTPAQTPQLLTVSFAAILMSCVVSSIPSPSNPTSHLLPTTLIQTSLI